MSAVNSAVYGVSYVHKKSSYPEVSEYPVVKQLLDAAKRILARPVSSFSCPGVLCFFLDWDDLHHLSVDSLNFGVIQVTIFLRTPNGLFTSTTLSHATSL